MSQSIQTSYEEIPYRGIPFQFTHPDNLATSAELVGIKPVSPEKCRVLELGCGDGGNIIPMAESLPQSEFVGIDLGHVHIEEGKKRVAELGITNLDLQQLDIAEFGPEFGEFDYIIAHGVYSWVPPVVQKRILEICSNQLSAKGIACISYNTLPGWQARGMIREMARYHLPSTLVEPAERVREARAFSNHVADGLAGFNDPYSRLLGHEFERMRGVEDFYFFHEHLEEFNEPLFLHQFLERAESNGLKYLGDGDIRLMLPGLGDPAIEQFLQSLSSDPVRRQQYTDFVFNRTFRKTLLCREDVEINYQVDPSVISGFHVSTSAELVFEGNQFLLRSADGTSLPIRSPLIKAALHHLSDIRPNSVPIGQLLEIGLKNSTGSPAPDDLATLNNWLLAGQSTAPSPLINLCSQPPRFTAEISEFPEASPVARLQAENNYGWVTTRRHQNEQVDCLHRTVLKSLDGTQGRADLLDPVVELRKGGKLEDAYQNTPDSELVELCLRNFAAYALLVS